VKTTGGSNINRDLSFEGAYFLSFTVIEKGFSDLLRKLELRCCCFPDDQMCLFFQSGYWYPITGCDDQGLWCVLLWLTCLSDKHVSVALFGPCLSEVSIVNFSTFMGVSVHPVSFRARSSILHDDGGSRFPRNTDNCLQHYMVSELGGP
jgi:hypothetical protein